MPLSLRLAALSALGAAAGVSLPHTSWRLAMCLAAASAAAAWLAHRRAVRGAAATLLAVAMAGASAGRAMLAAGDAGYPPLVRWFEHQTAGIPHGEQTLRETPLRVRARLVRDAAPTGFGAQLQLDVSHIELDGAWQPMRGGLGLSVSGAFTEAAGDWRAGRTIEAPVTIRRPAQYRNVGLADQALSLARRGMPLVGSTKSALLVEVRQRGAWWDEGAAAFRARVRQAMHRRVAPHAAASAAIGTAILIGDRAQLTPALEQRLQEAGTYHVVAISGGNIALLAGAVVGMLWACRIRFGPAAAITAAVLIAYAWAIGGGASVVRATAMAATYLALRVIDQRTRPVHALAVSAAGLLLVDPLEIVGAGFWLTFGATAALIATAARWPASTGARWWSPLAAIALASLAVELFLMPISAYVFERVTVAGLALNLVAVPAMGMVQGAASLCVLADAVGMSRAADAAGYLTHVAATALIGGSGVVRAMPWATWRVPPPSAFAIAAYYLTVGTWLLVSRPPIDSASRRRAARASAGGAIVLWGWIAAAPLSWLPPPPGGPLRITAVDVGQGDAFLVTVPDGQTLMVDAGGLPVGAFDIGDRIVGPALRARGVRRLDYVAVTHADLDHLGGAAALVRDFAPREVWAGVPVAGHMPLEALRGLAHATRTPWRWVQRGDRLEMGPVQLIAHHPPIPDWERQRVRNDDSLVLEVRHGAVSVWLTGDVSGAVEQELLAAADPRRINVVKAAHHGSLTSSGRPWVEHLRPAVVLISAGRGNLFGHPAPAVLARYASVGAEIFRTDQDGQIDLVTNGTSLEVTTFTGRRWRLKR